jgi:hypothetical protein
VHLTNPADNHYYSLVQRHAQTLTGAKGQPIQRIVISEIATQSSSSHSRRANDPTPSKAAHAAPKSGKNAKSKTPQLSSADKLKAKIEAEKQTKKGSEDEVWWKAQLKDLEGVKNLDERIGKVEGVLRGKRTEKGWLSVEVSLYQIHLILSAWIADENGEDEAVCERYIVRVLQHLHKLREHRDLFPAAAQAIAQVLLALGFESFTPPTANTQEDRELGFKFVKLVRSKSGRLSYPHLRIKTSPTEFQLKAYGVYMDRSMDSAPDPRVGFEPDGWQRQVSPNSRLISEDVHLGYSV